MKNIILIVTDTFRYDNLGTGAARSVRTPELDRFAAERATSIERFHAGSFPTIPHRTDLATGTIGWPHYGWQPIDQSSPNHVARMLNKAGYATQLLCDCPHLFGARFQHGFDAAYQTRGQEGDIPFLHLNDAIEDIVPDAKTRTRPRFRGHTLVNLHRWTNRNPRCEGEMFPPRTAELAVRWLEENYCAAPFFLWLDFFDPHEPWDPPEYLVRRYDPDYDGVPMTHCNYGPASAYTPEELHNLWAHYAAEAELVDRWVGRVLQKIDDLDLWDDTIVVVTSDHGTSLGEHDRTGKSNIREEDPRYWPLYPEIGHVPFLLAGGDVPCGQRLGLIAQPVDILPTVAELAGVDIDPPVPLHGLSFAEAVRDGKNRHRDQAITGCHIAAAPGVRPRRSSTPFVVTEEWGYAPVGTYGRQELYDLKADPLAEHDVAADHADVVSEMRARFLQHLSSREASRDFVDLWRSAGAEGDGSWAIDYPNASV